MKIAFCLMSNRPEKCKSFAQTFNHAMVTSNQYTVYLSHEGFARGVIAELEKEFSKHGAKLVCGERKANRGMFNYCEARLHGFAMARYDDFIVCCDDDFRFTAGSNLYKWSAGERYEDCFQYLLKQESCGVILTKGFLGGVPCGRWILPMNGGFFEMGTGMVLRGHRNRGYKELIDRRLIAPGAGEDAAICITSMLNGYYIAKALNMTINKAVTKKIFAKKGKSEKNVVNAGAYSKEFVEQRGVFKRISDVLGEYRHGCSLPPNVVNQYRQYAANKNFIVMF